MVNKDFTDDRIVEAAENALSQGMQHVKLYFMCGLPTETDEDVLGMARIALRIREEVMMPRARATGRMGRITLSVNPFVPKPWTPFQWAPMHDAGCLAAKRRLLEKRAPAAGHRGGLPQPRARPTLQTLLSRGDRRCADLLEIALPRDRAATVQRALPALAARPGLLRHRARPGSRSGCPGTSSTTASRSPSWRASTGAAWGRRITPKCALETCRACGLACADHPELRLPEPAAGVQVP